MAETTIEWTATKRPKRIQRKRTKGWRMPANTVYVGRPTMWGNPFSPSSDVVECIEAYRKGIETGAWGITVEDVIRELRGKDLCCWCGLDQPCHADVLLELANKHGTDGVAERSC